MISAQDDFENGKKYSMIKDVVSRDIAFRRVECIMDYQRKLCNILGHGHQLKPARIQIIPSKKIQDSTPKGIDQIYVDDKKIGLHLLVYKFSSPLLMEYIQKKVMMFTVPTPLIPFNGQIEEIEELEDVKQNKNVVFLLQSSDQNLHNQYTEIAAYQKERYFFIFKNTTNDDQSNFTCIGYNFTKSIQVSYYGKNPVLSKKQIETQMLDCQFQDLLVWDYNRHIMNETYLDTLKNKLIVVGLAGRITNYLTTDFLYDFRKLTSEYRYSLNKYEFAIIDIDEEQMFYYLTSFNLGRFDSPGIFIINDMDFKEYYRNYEVYNGSKNFRNLSEELISAVKKGEKQPLYAKWKDCYRNLVNIEHWNNNRLKAYMYFLGVLSVLVLPIALIVDCFFPLFGRGPHAKKQEEKMPIDKQQQDSQSKTQSQNKSDNKQKGE